MFTLDGSGSYDTEEDPLTYYWHFTSVPEGSEAVIDDPTAEITSFTADLAGQYVVSLIVNDGYADSEPDEVIIIATSPLVALRAKLDEILDKVESFEAGVFKNKNSQNTLINKLYAFDEMVDEGNYNDALKKLQKDILKKTDGCALSGSPDKNDWIKTCDEQTRLYNLIVEAIELLGML